jgi:hypothetical protein
MDLLKIIKLSTKTWKHNSNIDGDFILTKFYAKQENTDFLLVESYGAKRRKYKINEIEVYNIGGTAETFTNFEDLFLRLEELNYPAFYVDGEFIFNPSNYDLEDFTNESLNLFVREDELNFLSNNPTTYPTATTPIADTDQLFVIQGGVVKKVDKSEIGGASSPIWTGQINSKITHTGTTNITAMASIDIPSNININNNRTIIEIDTFAIASTIVTNANFFSYITINQNAVYNASERVATYATSVTFLPKEMSLNRRVICLGNGDVSSQSQYSSLSDFDAGNNYRRVESNFLTDDKKKITAYLKLDNASNTAVFYGMLVKIYQTP